MAASFCMTYINFMGRAGSRAARADGWPTAVLFLKPESRNYLEKFPNLTWRRRQARVLSLPVVTGDRDSPADRGTVTRDPASGSESRVRAVVTPSY